MTSATSLPRVLPRALRSILCLGLTLGALALGGCSIEQEDQQEAKVKVERVTGAQLLAQATNDYERFMANCRICIEGNLSNEQLDELVATYLSTYTGKLQWGPDAFLYQRMEPTNAFEKCATKAMIMGNKKPFDNMIVRQGRIARTARFFYANHEPAEGAFWLRRLVNVKGERDGLEIAGRVFIQDMRTIPAGVKLLEQSARLGNHNARQMLLGLMNPGSTYYQEITANTYVEDEAEQGNNLDAADNGNGNGTAQNQKGKKGKKGKPDKNQQQALASEHSSSAEQAARGEATLKRLAGKDGAQTSSAAGADNPQLRNRKAHEQRLAQVEARTEQMRSAAMERIKKLEAKQQQPQQTAPQK